MKRNNGFTLLEVMITVAIIGILAGLAVPNMSVMIGRSKLKTETRELKNNLQKVKFIAINENRIIDVTINAGNLFVKDMLKTVLPDGTIVYNDQTFSLPNGTTLTHNLVGTGCSMQINSRGLLVFGTSTADDPYIKVSSSFGDKIIEVSLSGRISIL